MKVYGCLLLVFLGRSHIEVNQKGQGTLCDAYSNENASN